MGGFMGWVGLASLQQGMGGLKGWVDEWVAGMGREAHAFLFIAK